MKNTPVMLLILLLGIATSGAAVAQGKSDKARGCPPGLAKKAPACVPPGLAKASNASEKTDHLTGRDRSRLERNSYLELERGDRVAFEGREYVVVSASDGILLERADRFYRLPRPNAGSFVRVGEQIYRIDEDTQDILDIVTLADLLLN